MLKTTFTDPGYLPRGKFKFEKGAADATTFNATIVGGFKGL